MRTGFVVTLQLKLAAGASTSPPLAQVQLVVAPYVITQLRFAYPPMLALTQLNSNADSARLTFPTAGIFIYCFILITRMSPSSKYRTSSSKYHPTLFKVPHNSLQYFYLLFHSNHKKELLHSQFCDYIFNT